MKTLNGVIYEHRKSIVVLLFSILGLVMVAFSGTAAANPSAQQSPEGGVSCPGGQCFEDVPESSPFYGYANNLYQQGIVSGYTCGSTPAEPCMAPDNRPYYRPASDVTRAQMTKFVDLARKQPGIRIDTATDLQPLYSRTTVQAGNAYALRGESPYGVGVYGSSVYAYALYGISGSNGYAGYLVGKVQVAGNMTVTGNLTVGGNCTGCTGPSKMDHPQDPANKYLYHSAVESQDMMNIYNGNVTLDAKGEAVVAMPAWFQALNSEFRYQLTAIGAPGPNLYVAEKIKDNRFKIAGGKAGMEVSWMVTGIKHDPYSEQHRTPMEVDKPQEERGLYLHPEAYGQPDTKKIGKIDRPELPNAEEPNPQP